MSSPNQTIKQLNENAQAPESRGRNNKSLFFAGTIWLTTIALGMISVWSYAHEHGKQLKTQLKWPAATQIKVSGIQPTLMLFAHPKCPCTRSSLREMERMIGRVGHNVDVLVVFYLPPSADESWRESDLVHHAKSIPGVRVVFDSAGFECELFQARTSGLTLLYSKTGELLFQGGVTFSRGHEGGNDGITSLTALILGKPSAISQTPVYGCPLQNTLTNN